MSVLVVSLVLAAGVTAFLISPAHRTRSYFALARICRAYGPPLTYGKVFLARLRTAAEPFAPIWMQVEPGVTMRLDPDDLVSRMILRSGAWEPGTWQAIQEHLPRGGTFVDVGAHIGYCSLKAAARVGPSGRVIAIEPNPHAVEKLRENVRASGATVVSVQAVACSDAEGTADLYLAAASNTGATSLSKTNALLEGPLGKTYAVRARTLDDIIRETAAERVDVVKIDVEGAQFLVLRGAQQTLDRYRPVVIVELFEHHLAAMGTSSAEIVEFMRAHGYRPSYVPGENVVFLPA